MPCKNFFITDTLSKIQKLMPNSKPTCPWIHRSWKGKSQWSQWWFSIWYFVKCKVVKVWLSFGLPSFDISHIGQNSQSHSCLPLSMIWTELMELQKFNFVNNWEKESKEVLFFDWWSILNLKSLFDDTFCLHKGSTWNKLQTQVFLFWKLLLQLLQKRLLKTLN